MAVNIISTLKTMANKLINLNNTKLDIATMQKLYGEGKELVIDWVKPTSGNWTTTPTTKKAWLLGDKILFNIDISRTGSHSAGNITNEVVGTFKIHTLGAISNAYAYSTVGTTYSQMSTLAVSDMSISGSGSQQVLTFSITVAAAHASNNRVGLISFIPVRPNISYYGLG